MAEPPKWVRASQSGIMLPIDRLSHMTEARLIEARRYAGEARSEAESLRTRFEALDRAATEAEEARDYWERAHEAAALLDKELRGEEPEPVATEPGVPPF